jgi:hypothetical protein
MGAASTGVNHEPRATARYFELVYLKSTITTQVLPELKFVILTDATGLSSVTF